MQSKTIFALLAASILAASVARADYLEVRRSATIKDAPDSQGSVLERVDVDASLTLLDDGVRKNGYYHVATPTTREPGWVYRTLVLRHPGSAPGQPSAPVSANGPLSGATMKAHFIDVGQGNSTLLEFSCGAVLIDAGGESDATTQKLIAYLNTFFAHRTDLHKTLNTVFVTHTHIDHNRALQAVAENFTIRNYVHNGILDGSGRAAANWIIKNADNGETTINVEAVSEAAVEKSPNSMGRTGPAIDAVNCPGADPAFHVVNGPYDEDPGWPSGEFENGNNKSIVIRVDFGLSSFLFPGDLEEDAITSMVERYKNTRTLDVDVLEVGHHGSHNGTTEEELEAVTPKIAVISVGLPTVHKKFTTWAYGHPRKVALDLLQQSVSDPRNKKGTFKAGIKAEKFVDYQVDKAVYATGWDKNIVIKADTGRHYEVQTEQ